MMEKPPEETANESDYTPGQVAFCGSVRISTVLQFGKNTPPVRFAQIPRGAKNAYTE
jgi:hypothetical protein